MYRLTGFEVPDAEGFVKSRVCTVFDWGEVYRGCGGWCAEEEFAGMFDVGY